MTKFKRRAEKLNALAKFYLTNVSSPITFNSIEKFLEVSASTVEKYSDYLNSAYLTFFLKRFSFKVKEQEKSLRKVYAIDPGLANAVGFRFSQNMGRLAENKDIRHREVDFVVKKSLKPDQLIQVCWSLEDRRTKSRELKSLPRAWDELGVSEGLVITEDYEATEGKFQFVPLPKWLLAE